MEAKTTKHITSIGLKLKYILHEIEMNFFCIALYNLFYFWIQSLKYGKIFSSL